MSEEKGKRCGQSSVSNMGVVQRMVLWVVSNGVMTYLCMGFSAPGTLVSATIYTPHCSPPGSVQSSRAFCCSVVGTSQECSLVGSRSTFISDFSCTASQVKII